MNAEVQAFVDKMAAKSAAKARVMEALGKARLAELQGEDATEHWDVVASQGLEGVEGVAYRAAFETAEAYVTAHPEQFAFLEPYVSPERHGELVDLATVFRERGLDEEATKVTMFELVRFERQSIGAETKAKVRMPGGKG